MTKSREFRLRVAPDKGVRSGKRRPDTSVFCIGSDPYAADLNLPLRESSMCYAISKC